MEINKNDFIQDYVTEAQENLDGIDNAAISLINSPRDYEILKELLRLLHTLKGSSRMMDFSQIEQVVNNLESVFKNFQVNRMEIPSSFCYLVLNVNEFLRKTINKIQQLSENSNDDIKNLDSSVQNFEVIIENIKFAAEGKSFNYNFSDNSKDKKSKNENSPSQKQEKKSSDAYIKG